VNIVFGLAQKRRLFFLRLRRQGLALWLLDQLGIRGQFNLVADYVSSEKAAMAVALGKLIIHAHSC